MSAYFNFDIDNIIQQYEFQYQNADQKFLGEHKQNIEIQLLEYEKIAKENSKTLKRLSDVNNKIIKNRDTLQHKTDRFKCEQQILQTENERLASVKNECNGLAVIKIQLNDAINENKVQLTQMNKAKNATKKTLKMEINEFRDGANMYEQFLQLSMNIGNKEKNTVLNITMKNVNNQSDYNVVFGYNDNNSYKLLDIIPRSQSIMEAATLYNHNKDIQGLLAFLCNTKQ